MPASTTALPRFARLRVQGRSSWPVCGTSEYGADNVKLRSSAALALVPIALGLLLPGRAHSAAEDPPSVDLAHLSVAPDGATAPLVAGGTAELTLDPRLQQGALRLLARARP